MTNEARKAELKEQIERAALRIFRTKGYEETKILDIAREAKVSPSTIYLYYEGKKALFEALRIPEAEMIRPEYDRRREDVTRAALEVFGRCGYEGTTMDAIADRLGFTRSALYQYCSSKEDLFYQVLNAYTHGTPPTDEELGITGGDWHQVLRRIASTYLSLEEDRDRTSFLGAVLRESEKFPEIGSAYYRRSFCVARDNLERYLKNLQEEERVRRDIEPRQLATVFFTSLTGRILLHRLVTDAAEDITDEAFIERLCRMMISRLELRE